MFPSSDDILDIQSWWEVPSIAYFCSLFRTAFNLLDFDIEELEEALLTDGTEESASSLLTELIVRLLNGCLGNNDISAFNYQMYLRRLFRRKCQETRRANPFDSDIDFQFLPLRTKVEILYALCDFRLDADDVFDLFKNLEAESLRVEPLGWDDNESAYWYFYGTRLYREDIIKKAKGKGKKKKLKEGKKRGWFRGVDWIEDDEAERVWQVVCFTEEDWTNLTEKFSQATSKVEKELYRSLSQNFLPEIPRLFQEKERLQRKRLLEFAPRRTSNRVLQKIKQKEEEEAKQSSNESKDEEERKDNAEIARENRAKRRDLLRSKSLDSSTSSESENAEMPLKPAKRSKSHDKRSKNSSVPQKGEPPPEPPIKTGRKTNNSLASATGQIVIPDQDEPVNSTRKKLKTSQIFRQTEEDIQTDMYKVLEQLTAHDDAWPFIDPVEEEYAPNYYTVIRRPMDLRKMEERLDNGYYTDFSMFKADFKLIVNNCRLYNGQDNEYTKMVDNLQLAFDRLTEKYMHRLSSSDEEIAVEYQLPTPPRKPKRKSSESPTRKNRKKKKSHSEFGDPKSSTADADGDKEESEQKEKSKLIKTETELKKPKESHKNKEGKGKKKRKGHHRHGKHSKNHKKGFHKSEHGESKKHSKKQKHTKKDKEGKRTKKVDKKKKKSKHVELEVNEPPKRSESRESLESSNRSRSASPLPSIHTPSPSPTELDPCEPQHPDFFKDKYDKIKERRRAAAKDAWESLFDYKQKNIDKQKQNLNIPDKDKNQKLRETIEKLKAKNEKYKESSVFNSLFTPSHTSTNKSPDTNINESSNVAEEELVLPEFQNSHKGKIQKKSTGKNESASEALEQAVKDISKWLDDAPKASAGSSPCDSPAQTISTEDHENSRLDDEFSQGERSLITRKDLARKRPSSREPKLLVKRREIQRTIDRLQPGKSKGNLLTNLSKNTEKPEEVTPQGTHSKVRETLKSEESSPKLSLGSVLATVEFSLGKDHKFMNNEEKDEGPKETLIMPMAESENDTSEVQVEQKPEEPKPEPCKKDAEIETDPVTLSKPSQEKATPNLSAWFKAFGTPKSTTSTTLSNKKKTDEPETEEKVAENTSSDVKSTSPKNTAKFDSPTNPETPNPDGGDSPLPNVSATPRQRRTSTGSSVSERSSFSQDLDSPRHQMSHTSPLLRSPASPRTDDFQKITYPIINGTVRAGFYQDTTSIKSSPEKSCSPREAPQSPFSPYSQHVYASNNMTGASTPNYFADHNKSPLPTYSVNPPPFYDTTKASTVNKPGRTHEDYTSLGPDSYQVNQYGQYSPAHSPYSQSQPTNHYSQAQNSPQPTTSEPVNTATSLNSTQTVSDHKSTLFPVKKRTYNEQDVSTLKKEAMNSNEIKDAINSKNDYQKVTQSVHSVPSFQSTSVDDIALALGEKSEMAKLNSLREKCGEYMERNTADDRDKLYENPSHDVKKKPGIEPPKAISVMKKDNVDMINMGYMNPDNDRRNSNETQESNLALCRDLHKAPHNPHPKDYEVDPIAINLGVNNQQVQKSALKPNMTSNNIPAAHSHDRSNNDTVNLTHAHHNQFESMPSGQSINNFSLNDIELANKKLYGCNTMQSSSALDYGNWKSGNQANKQDMVPSDYSNSYNINTEKIKSDINTAAINYENKNVHHQQYNNYNTSSKTNMQRTHDLQQNLPSELRIPNPRGLLKSDVNIASSISDSNLITKNMESIAKSQSKTEKLIQNHPLIGSIPYKTPYSSTHSPLPLDSLRNLPNIPQMLERYTNDERYLSTFASSTSALYHDKTFQMAQMFNKSIASDVHSSNTTSIYSQSSAPVNKDNNIYKNNVGVASNQVDTKPKTKRKRTSDTKHTPIVSQSYHTPCNTDVLSSVKSNMMPGSAFSFGSSTNMALGGGLYADNSGFSMEDFRNSTANQLMAANYMAAAVAHQQRNNAEANADKIVKPAHQNSSSSFPFMGHSQVRGGYGFDPSSPLYQQYLQRHQEELLRQTGAQIMSLYPPGYPASLAGRQPYDAINRPSWL